MTTGCTEGIAAALLGLVDPGDEVVVLEPYYDSYLAMIEFAGGVRRPVTLRAPDYRLDVDALRAAITPRTRLILLNTPHNPTGTVLTRDELQAVADVAIEHDLVVVTDEVYEHLVFDHHTARAAGDAAGDVGAHADAVERRQELLVHRLEGRLGDRAARPRRRGAGRQAVADLHVRVARCSPPSRTRSTTSRTSRPRSRRSLQARRDLLVAGLADAGPHRPRAGGHLLRHHRHQPPRLGRRAGVLPGPARAWRAWSRSPRRSSTTTRGAGRHLVRWAFCKEADVISEGVRRLAAADLHRR